MLPAEGEHTRVALLIPANDSPRHTELGGQWPSEGADNGGAMKCTLLYYQMERGSVLRRTPRFPGVRFKVFGEVMS